MQAMKPEMRKRPALPWALAALSLSLILSPARPAAQSVQKAREVSALPSPEKGEKLFTGAVAFQRGGPSCLACHNISGISFPGGGTLGPDLTGVYGKFGAKELGSILASLSYPTMAPLYQGRPLTPDEQRHLAVFFQKASTRIPEKVTWKIFLLALGITGIFLLLTWGIWRKRLLTVRKALVEKGGT